VILRRIFPKAGGELDSDAADARQTLLDWYKPHATEYLRLNFIATLDGRAAGADGTSESLTSRVDRMILGVIRQYADVVLVGAETVRREGYRRPRRAALAIVSASGDLTGHRVTERRSGDDPLVGSAPVTVFTTEHGAERAALTLPASHVVRLPCRFDGRLDPGDVVESLRAAGFRGIAAEGGPTLAAELITANLVDEVCLTVMPNLGGPALPMLGTGAVPVTTTVPRQLLVTDEGVQFGRWALRPERHLTRTDSGGDTVKRRASPPEANSSA